MFLAVVGKELFLLKLLAGQTQLIIYTLSYTGFIEQGIFFFPASLLPALFYFLRCKN